MSRSKGVIVWAPAAGRWAVVSLGITCGLIAQGCLVDKLLGNDPHQGQAATVLTFMAQPAVGIAGAAMGPFAVAARNDFGEVDSTFTGAVTLAIESNPAGSGGKLVGGVVQHAVSGVASFAELSIAVPGAGYVISAASEGLLPATSAPLNIISGDQARMRLVSGDGQTGVVGSPLPEPYVVRLMDASGSGIPGVTIAWVASAGEIAAQPTTDSTGLAIATHTLGTTSGAQTATARVPGVPDAPVTFSTTATAGPPADLQYQVPPSATPAGHTMRPAVKVAITDHYGNVAAAYRGPIHLMIGTNPGGGSLSGTTTRDAADGLATFGDLVIDRAGRGYTLAASASGVLAATSAAFDITTGPANLVALVSGDAQTDTVGATLRVPYQIFVADAAGNPVGGALVAWTVTGGGGSITANSATDASGNALATRVLGTTVGQQTARASVGGLSPVDFTAFATPATPRTLTFSTQPTDASAGAPISPAVGVTAWDRFGNLATNFTRSVAIAFEGEGGNATLFGTTTRVAAGGVASFGDLFVDKSGAGYILVARAEPLDAATSLPFAIIPGAPSSLITRSGDAQSDTVGATLPTPYTVHVADRFDNAVPGVGVTWDVTQGGGSITSSSTTDASGDASATRVLGTTAGEQQAQASVSGLSPVSFTATATPATPQTLWFSRQPSDTKAGAVIKPPVAVTVADRFDNVVVGFAGSISIAIGNNPGGGNLAGATARPATDGVATFSDLSVDRAGKAYTLVATVGGLTPVTSAAFDITGSVARSLRLVAPDALPGGPASSGAVAR